MKLIASVYSKLLNFYPSSYKNKFKNEQMVVFLEKIQEIRRYGYWKRLTCICHEFLALLAGVFISYTNSLGGKEMLTFKRIFNTNLICFTSTFVLLALVNFIGRYGLDYSSNIPKPLNYVTWLILSGGVMAFCGWFVSTSIAAKKKLLFAFAFGLMFIVSNLLTNTSLWERIGIPVTDPCQFFCVIFSPMIQGLGIGLLFGLLWKGWKAAVIHGITGGIIFELGYGANLLILFIINNQIQAPITPETVGYGWLVATWVLAYIIFGLVIGSLWGLLLDKSNRMTLKETI